MDAQTTSMTPSIKKKTTKPQDEQAAQAAAAAPTAPPTAAGNDAELLASQTTAASARLAAAKRELADLSASHAALTNRLARARTEAARACRRAVAMAAGAPKGGQALVEASRELESARAAYVERWRNLEWLSHRLRVAQEGLRVGLGLNVGLDGSSSSSSEDEEDGGASEDDGSDEDDQDDGGGF